MNPSFLRRTRRPMPAPAADVLSSGIVALGRGPAREWRVIWGGVLCTPSWPERGPAVAYLAGLSSGHRRPEFPE